MSARIQRATIPHHRLHSVRSTKRLEQRRNNLTTNNPRLRDLTLAATTVSEVYHAEGHTENLSTAIEHMTAILNRPIGRPGADPETVAEILKLRKQGKTLAEISEQLGVAKSTVGRYATIAKSAKKK